MTTTIARRAALLFALCLLPVTGLAETAPKTEPPAPKLGKKYRFNYAPPDGIKVVYKRTKTTSTTVNGEALPEAFDEIEAHGEIRRTESGYAWTDKMVRAVATKGGKPLDNPMVAAMVGTTMTLNISKTGLLESIDGVDVIRKKVSELLPPKQAAAIAMMLSPESVLRKEKKTFDDRYGVYHGEEFQVGEAFSGPFQEALPTGEVLKYEAHFAFPEEVKCPAGTCVRFTGRWDSASDTLMQEGIDAVKALTGGEDSANAKALDSVMPKPTRVSMAGSFDRVIHPETMVIFKETATQIFRSETTTPKHGPLKMERIETRVYEHTYTFPKSEK